MFYVQPRCAFSQAQPQAKPRPRISDHDVAECNASVSEILAMRTLPASSSATTASDHKHPAAASDISVIPAVADNPPGAPIQVLEVERAMTKDSDRRPGQVVKLPLAVADMSSKGLDSHADEGPRAQVSKGDGHPRDHHDETIDDLFDHHGEEIHDLPEDEAQLDPLFYALVKRRSSTQAGVEYHGIIRSIAIGSISQERLYEVLYD